MIVSVKKLLQNAARGGYAIGAFNTVNLETTRAILEAAAEQSAPVIIQMTEKTLDYGGGRAMFHLVKNIADFYFPGLPVGIHLDHGRNLAVVRRALGIGFKSVMMDASTLSYAENVAETKTIVQEARAAGADVQGEIGTVPYLSEVTDPSAIRWEDHMTDPDRAEHFVRETHVDTLAVAIGNAHGAFPERPEPDYPRLQAIHDRVHLPIVLHGASDWGEERVRTVTALGVACFNVDTATRTAFLAALREELAVHPEERDLRHALMPARQAAKEAVKQKITLFGAAGKA